MTNNQNKAPQTLAVRGYADNAFMALSEVTEQHERAFIIAKSNIKQQFDSNNLLGFGVGVGYSGGSKNQCSTRPVTAVLFYPSNIRNASHDVLRTLFGGVWYRQRPRCHWQLEHPHPYTVALNLKTNGGSHA